MITTMKRGAGRLFRRLSGDPSAASAVEFAIMLPIMLLMFFGTAEFGEAITIDRKVGHVASALGDLVAQSKSLSDADMQNILDASSRDHHALRDRQAVDRRLAGQDRRQGQGDGRLEPGAQHDAARQERLGHPARRRQRAEHLPHHDRDALQL